MSLNTNLNYKKWVIETLPMDYELLEEIGSGSFGKVFIAQRQDEIYAVKRIRKNTGKKFVKPLQATTSHINAIKREIAILKKINHSNCAKLIDAMEDETFYFLVFPLYKELDRTTMTIELEYLFNDLFLAIEYIHANNIVHLDIKPDNLLFDGQKIILCDFGLSELMSATTSTSSTSWTKSGTPGFTAPENLKSSCIAHSDLLELDKAKAADMWGFGMTLYYFKYNKLPFEDLNFIDRIEALTTQEIVLDDSDLSTVIRGLLAIDITSRFTIETVRQMISTFKNWPALVLFHLNVTSIVQVTPNEIEYAFNKVQFVATVIKAITRFKRGSKSSQDLNKELDKLQLNKDLDKIKDEL